MPVIDTFGDDIEVYVDIDAADVYLAASFASAALWDALAEEAKAQALVSATRMLDRQRWQGEKTASDQPLAWPRTGISGVEDDETPQGIIDGSIELAAAIAGGSDVETESNTSQKLSSIKAGSVVLSYFRGAEGAAKRFPTIVQELVGQYLASGVLAVTGVATGVDGESIRDKDFGLNQSL